MGSEWQKILLGDVAAELTVGHVGPMASEYAESGIPFLRSQNILPHRIELAEVKFITAAFHSRLAKSALRPGDIVVVRTGRPGAAAVIPKSLGECNCSDLVMGRTGDGGHGMTDPSVGSSVAPEFIAYLGKFGVARVEPASLLANLLTELDRGWHVSLERATRRMNRLPQETQAWLREVLESLASQPASDEARALAAEAEAALRLCRIGELEWSVPQETYEQQKVGWFREMRKVSATVLSVLDGILLFENPWADIPVDVRKRERFARLSEFRPEASWLGSPVLLKSNVESALDKISWVAQLVRAQTEGVPA
jgi:nucleotide-binding universal stress UspA family protein